MRGLVLSFVILLLAACSAAPSATSSAPAPASTAPASATAPASPSDGAESTLPPCQEGALCDGPAAGSYTSTTTGASITYTVPEGWLGQRDIDGAGFALYREDFGDFTGLFVTGFSGEVFADACNTTGELTTIDATPASFMTWLAERDGISAGAPAETTVGGRPALSLDVTSTLPAACADPPWIWLWALPFVGDFHLEDGETARIWAVEGAEATVIIVAEAFPGADWDGFLAATTEVIDGMEIDAGTSRSL